MVTGIGNVLHFRFLIFLLVFMFKNNADSFEVNYYLTEKLYFYSQETYDSIKE